MIAAVKFSITTFQAAHPFKYEEMLTLAGPEYYFRFSTEPPSPGAII